MSSGLILVLAVLVLGGVIATIGDRIGTRVGKARLSLFNLRPRKTATLVTIATGVIVAASTFGLLIGTSGPLRSGIFEYEKIQRDRRRAKADLQVAREEIETAKQQQAQVEKELNQARADQNVARQRLSEINDSLKTAIAERDRADAVRLQAQVELERNQNHLSAVSDQVLRLRSEIEELQDERKRVIGQAEEEIRAKNAVIQEREQRLSLLEAQQEFLMREVAKLEFEAEGLRRGNVAIQRGQVLASAVVRVVDPTETPQAIDQLLREANRNALQLARPGINEQNQIILIRRTEVEQLVNQIDDGQDYVVRILSAANYLIGEGAIQVVAEAVPNKVVFNKGDVVASTAIDPSFATDAEIQQRINLLLAASSFRARRLGILTDTVEIGRVQNLIAFVEKLKEYKQPVEVRAIASATTYTAGPLTVEFIVNDPNPTQVRSQPSD